MDWTAVIIALLGAKELFAFGHKALEHLSEKRKLDRLEQESDKLDEDQVAVLEEGFRTRLSSEQFKWGADYVIVLNVVNGTYFIRNNGPVSELKWKVRILHQLHGKEYDPTEERIENSFEQKPMLNLKGIVKHAKNVDGFAFRMNDGNIDDKMHRIMSYSEIGTIAGHCTFNKKNIPETLMIAFWKKHRILKDEELDMNTFSIYNFLTENNSLLG